MKLHIENFMGVEATDIPLEAGKVTVVAGHNASGKSSVACGAGAILSRKTNPVGLLGNQQKAYVRDGQEYGSVELYDDAGNLLLGWSAASHDITVAPEAPGASSPGSVGLMNFLTASDAERTKLFEEVFLPPAEELMSRISDALQGKLPEEDIRGVITTIRKQGWAGVDGVYVTRAKVAKDAWKHITGESWGTVKAPDWRPEGWASHLDGLTLIDCEKRVKANQDAVTGLHVAHALTASEKTRAEEARAQVPEVRAKLQVVKDDTAAKYAEVQTAIEGQVLADEEVARVLGLLGHLKAPSDLSKEHVFLKPRKETLLSCPGCKIKVFLSRDGILQEWSQGSYDAELKNFEERRKELRDEFNKKMDLWIIERDGITEQLKAAKGKLVDATHVVDAKKKEYTLKRDGYVSDKARLKILEDHAEDADCQVETDEMAREIEEANLHIESLRMERDRVHKKEQAWELHESITTYLLVASLLGSKGIRAEAMSKSMETFGQVLSFISTTTRWPLVQVRPLTYGIKIGKRVSHKLCSDSEKWRTQALLQVAVARMRRDPVIVLDRVDILDAAGREDLSTLVGLISSRANPPACLLCMTVLGGADEEVRGALGQVGHVVSI